MNDLKFAFRQLLKKPGFTAVAALSLAIGIGANATVLCWLQNLVFRPLPGVAGQRELVALVSSQGGGCVSLPDLRDFNQLNGVFTGTEASMSTPAYLAVERDRQWIEAQIVSASFFEVLGVRPILGRTFLPDEDQKPGGNPVLIISERLWRRSFGAAPDVVGRVVNLNRHAFTIVGVVPKQFHGSMTPSRCEVWAPASMISEVRNQGRYFLTQRDARGWHNLVRLQPGVSLAQARTAVAARDAQLTAAYPADNRDVHHRVVPLSQCPWGAQAVMGPALRLLLAVALGVHLIVAANVANLLLAIAVSRRKEIAVRLAAGASRLRLLRLFLIESVLLALLGGIGGVLFAGWAVNSVVWLLPTEIASRLQIDFNLDGTTLGLTLVLTLVTGILFGLAPSLQVTGSNLAGALKEGGRTSVSGVAHHRLRSSLVVAEVALALVLLVGASLCVKGLRQARHIDFGFNPNRLLIAGLQIGMNGYDQETGKNFYRQARQRLASLPGVEEAALASWFPLGLAGCKGSDVFVEGYERPPGEDTTYEYAIISPRYFAAMAIPLVAGRDFTDADDDTATPVAIVNENFARRFWPGQDALGRRFKSGGVWRTIVGVAKAGKYNRLDEPAWCFFYRPYQQGVPDLDLSLCVRTEKDPAAFAGTLREAMRQLDPGVELLQTLPLAVHSGMVLFPQRAASTLLTVLGVVALLLAAMGVYAVMAYAVGKRTQEFGVRIALGASRSNLLALVVGRGLTLAGTGVAIGLLSAVVLTRWLASFLYGVSPFDLGTFLGVPVVLMAVVFLACLLPAWRATLIDPTTALRAE